MGYGENNAQSSSLTHTNSTLNATTIRTETTGDTNIKGGNLDAFELLSMVVGGDLNIESQKDSYDRSSKGMNVSGGVGTGANGVSSISGGYGASNGRIKQKETILSSVTGGEVDIEVANNTHLKGALLAAGEQQADGHFADNGNLHLNTDTLTYTNTSNSLYISDNSFNVSTSVGFSEGNDEQGNPETKASLGTVNSSFSMGKTNEKSKTLATLGQGNIEVTDKEHSDDPERLNRDTDKVEKGLYAVSQHAGAEMALDTRIVTEEGRKEIAEDITTTGEAAGDIAFKSGAKEMSKALYDIDDPVIAEALKNNANTALDEMIERGIEPALAKQLLSTPELYQAASDILYAYDKAQSVDEYKDSVSTSNSGALELILRGPSTEEKVLLGLNDAKEYIDTLPTAQAQAAVVAIQRLTGGVVKTAVDFAKDLAVDTVFGNYLNQVKHDVAAKIAAHADNTTVSTHEFLLAYDEENETKTNATKSQNGAEFALEVVGIGAGVVGGKTSHSLGDEVKVKPDGTGTVLSKDIGSGNNSDIKLLGYNDSISKTAGKVQGESVVLNNAAGDVTNVQHFDRKAITEGFQDHHILSDKNKLTQNHELLDLAGVDLQKRQNKIFLPKEESLHPTRSIHNGRHTTQVSRNLAEQMDVVVEIGKQQGWSKQQYRQALDAIISQERQLLKSGERALNKNQRPWAQ